MAQISTKSLKALDDKILRAKSQLESLESQAVLHPTIIKQMFVDLISNQIVIMELLKEAEK